MRSVKIAFALFGLLLLWFVFFTPHKKFSSSTVEKQTKKYNHSNLQPHYSSTSSLSLNKNHILHTPKDGVKLEHKVEHLSSFYIPEIKFHNDSLAQAIEKLLYTYETVCLRTGERPIQFIYEIEGEPLGKLDLTAEGDFTSILNSIAFHLGMEIEQTDNSIRFIALPLSSNDVPTAHTFSVPPDFLSLISQQLRFDNNNLSAQDTLSYFKAQFYLDDSSTLSFSKARSQFTVRAGTSDISRLKQLIDNFRRQRPKQHRIRTQLFTIPSDDASTLLDSINNTQVTSGQAQILMRSIHQSPLAAIATLPSIVSRTHEDALIEISREQRVDHKNWEGIKFHVSSSQYGFGNTSSIIYEQNPYADQSNDPNSSHPVDSYAKIKRQIHTFNGNSIFLKTHESEGMNHYILVTQDLLDVTGKTVLDNNPRHTENKPLTEDQIIWARDE